jgi:hypothetical protein
LIDGGWFRTSFGIYFLDPEMFKMVSLGIEVLDSDFEIQGYFLLVSEWFDGFGRFSCLL